MHSYSGIATFNLDISPNNEDWEVLLGNTNLANGNVKKYACWDDPVPVMKFDISAGKIGRYVKMTASAAHNDGLALNYFNVQIGKKIKGTIYNFKIYVQMIPSPPKNQSTFKST